MVELSLKKFNFRFENINVLAIIVILIFVSLSGCTRSTPGSSSGSGAGLEIARYEVYPKTIYEDESVDIDLVIENRGSKTLLDDAKLWIYGPSSNEWLASGELEDAFSLSGLIINLEDMMPGDYDEVYGSFEYIGDVQQGTHKEYDFIARLCYPYVTTYVGNFYVVSRDEARLERKTGNIYDVLSSGPIGISFERRERVITGNVVKETGKAVRGSVYIGGETEVEGISIRIQGTYRTGTGETVRYVSLPIRIYNRGDGFPTLPSECELGPDVDSEERGYVAVRVLLDGYDITQSCFRDEDTRRVSVTYNNGNVGVGWFGIVKLRRERDRYTEGRITCRLEGLDFDTPERQYTLEVEAYYDYYTERRDRVIVRSVEDIY